MRRLALLPLAVLAFLFLRQESLQGSQEDPAAPIAIPYTIDAARVMTEVDGKATGWKAFFNSGGWVSEGSGKPAPKKKAKPKAKAKAKAKPRSSAKSKK